MGVRYTCVQCELSTSERQNGRASFLGPGQCPQSEQALAGLTGSLEQASLHVTLKTRQIRIGHGVKAWSGSTDVSAYAQGCCAPSRECSCPLLTDATCNSSAHSFSPAKPLDLCPGGVPFCMRDSAQENDVPDPRFASRPSWALQRCPRITHHLGLTHLALDSVPTPLGSTQSWHPYRLAFGPAFPPLTHPPPAPFFSFFSSSGR